MSQSGNPCMVCAVDLKCCKTMGLKLSRREYEKHFQKHSNRFSVTSYGEMVIVFPKDDHPCPYLTRDGCNIYRDRPIDCRLYPFELNRIVEKRGRIEIVLNDQTDCPHREALFIPVEEALELAEDLAREVLGPDKPVQIKYVPGKKPRRAFGPLNPLIAKLSKAIRSKH